MPPVAAGTLVLTSPAFAEGAAIPRRHAYRGEGDDIPPPLAWHGAPEGTRAFALAVDDPDAPSALPWVHWLLADIPGDLAGLAEGDGARWTEGRNDYGVNGWGGPLPPSGHGPHRYRFRLYALDAPLGLQPGFDVDELTTAMDGRVLAMGELTGTYER